MGKMKEIATIDTAANHFLTAANQAGGSDPLLKCTKGKYYSGGNDDEVPMNGREFVVVMSDVSYGWVKFVDKKVVDQKIGRISEGFVAENRDALGDTDKSQWEIDSRNEARDPWALQWYVPIADFDSGEGFVFVGGSGGARRAVGNLLRTYGRNSHKGNPIVNLGVRSYKHKEYGRIEEPEIKIVGWEKQPPLAAKMNDTIPF
jgi:hypothetical protein